MATLAELSATVRDRRHALSLTQRDLAELSGVSQRLVVQVEGGKSTIQLDKVLAILDVLGLEMRTGLRETQ